MWIDYVNKVGKGKVQIKVLGGPEVIGKLDQFEANRAGIIDMTFGVGGYCRGIMPEGQFMGLSPWPTPKYPDCAKQERASGLIDLMEDVLHDYGLEYMGRTLLFSPIYFFSKTPINTPSDLDGMKVRSLSRYNHLVEAFGAVPSTFMEAEMYTALERGTVNGFVHALLAVYDLGWIDFTKYCTPEPFFEQDAWVQCNLETWNSLPDNVKKLLDDTILYAEEEYATKYYKALVDETNKKLLAAGLKYVELSPADSKLWQDTLHSGTMKFLEENAKPAFFARFKDIVAKAEAAR